MYIHGHSVRKNGKKTKSPEWTAWSNMKSRCNNPKYKGYKDYGGRGIRVCPEWLYDFKSFLQAIGPKPINTVLDRIDNNKGYFPENVRWVNRSISNLNRRSF